MNRSYVAGCCAIVAAAGLGYWIFSDRLPLHRPPPPALVLANDSSSDGACEKPVIYAARTTGDVIDLARVYDPTGEELELHTLLHGQPLAELIPAPREAETEIAPAPREAERELLHSPRIVISTEAGEEASSLASAWRNAHDPFKCMLAWLFAEWLNRSLPLKGIDLPGGSQQ